jgi:hypothetical protein
MIATHNQRCTTCTARLPAHGRWWLTVDPDGRLLLFCDSWCLKARLDALERSALGDGSPELVLGTGPAELRRIP